MSGKQRSIYFRFLSGFAWTLLVLALLLLASFAIPLPEWRTGRGPVEPLALTRGGPVSDLPRRVWIDTDAACGAGERTDPDDCFALLLLLRDPAWEVVGVSTVFGNAPLDVTDPTARALVAETVGPHGATVPVYRGSPDPISDTASVAPAQAALRDALRAGPLTLLALGPLTNIARVLDAEPTLASNVARLVAVMGRRPGHLFHPAEGEGPDALLFGHGPVFRDFNFEQDPAAAKAVLARGLPITLVPYDAARGFELRAEDLDALMRRGGAAAWTAARARDWLRFWNEDIGRAGFYPFDLMAAAYVLDPRRFDCAHTRAWIARDDRLWRWFYRPQSLLVGPATERPARVDAEHRLLYCPRARPWLRDWLVARLSREPPPARRASGAPHPPRSISPSTR